MKTNRKKGSVTECTHLKKKKKHPFKKNNLIQWVKFIIMKTMKIFLKKSDKVDGRVFMNEYVFRLKLENIVVDYCSDRIIIKEF